MQELTYTSFTIKLLESPITSNPADNPTGNVFLSTARTYFAFVDFTDKEVICPEVSARIRIVFLDPDAALNVTAENGPEIPLAAAH